MSRRFALACVLLIALVLVAGLYFAIAKSTVYVPETAVVSVPQAVPQADGKAVQSAGPDLLYYRTVVERVRNGENYYDVAHEELPRWGFPIGSMFNWRLPTYAYVLALFPSQEAIRILLTLLAMMGVLLAFVSEQKERGPLGAAATTLLLIGVATWPLAGNTCYAQEVWAGVLILLSVGAAGCAAFSPRWRIVSVIAGLAALFFRELVLPYCVIAGMLAFWNRRRWESLAWFAGVAVFFAYLVWHGQQVAAKLTPEDRVGSTGVMGWVVFGGLPFDIMATRMNAFLMTLPGWLVFLYLLLGVIGLASWHSEQGMLVSLTTFAYLMAFAVVGKPMNFNWGLMFAPLLPFGVVRGPAALASLYRAISGTPPAQTGETL
jgi:hypothetical protein